VISGLVQILVFQGLGELASKFLLHGVLGALAIPLAAAWLRPV
jgi:hypothetical protein